MTTPPTVPVVQEKSVEPAQELDQEVGVGECDETMEAIQAENVPHIEGQRGPGNPLQKLRREEMF